MVRIVSHASRHFPGGIRAGTSTAAGRMPYFVQIAVRKRASGLRYSFTIVNPPCV